MSLVRHEGSYALVDDHRYMDGIPKMAELFAKSGLCPETFRGKPDDIAIIGYALADNGCRLTLNTLPMAYVVHGRPGFMAQLQIAFAAKCGYDIYPLSGACDEKSATVVVVTPHGERREVTFTMAEATKGGLTKPRPKKDGGGEIPSMYAMWPVNMLVARAVTRAITWHCPAVKLGMAGTVDMAEIEVIDAVAHEAPVESGEAASTVERRTYFETLRGRDGAVKAKSIEGLRAAAIPGPKADELTSAQVSQALGIIWAAVDAVAEAPPCEGAVDEEPADGEVVEPEPDALFDHDDAGRAF